MGWGSGILDPEKTCPGSRFMGRDPGSARLKTPQTCQNKNPCPRLLPSQVISCGLESVRKISTWSAGLSFSHRASTGEAAASTNLNISEIF
jgi:hypothetical protein